MRLQLIATVMMLMLSLGSFGQSAEADSNRAPIDVNFLFNYYSQDGNNSAVTGGTGTEELEDISAKMVLRVPVDSTARVILRAGINHYSSASTDRIDFRISSASSVDNRVEAQLDYGRDFGEGRKAFSYHAGASIESDYLSSTVGGSMAWRSKNRSRSFVLSGDLFLDRWIIYFPEELRRDSLLPSIPTDRRRSLQFSASWQQVLNRRLQFELTVEPGLQQGLLSTPFHRVYFAGENTPGIERFPTWKIRFAAAGRLHAFVSPFLVLKSGYRIYVDDFGVLAHTIDLEVPLKAGSSFSISPFYRYHNQSAADFFAPFAQHEQGSVYHTSDWDLSAFHSHQLGAAIRIEPAFGIGGSASRAKISPITGLRMRGGWYKRSDGLEAWMVSLETQWRVDR